MCTAITYQTGDFYFGRNLDLERSYNERVTITPRSYPFVLRNGAVLERHYAMIGMAAVSGGYPLYYEAANEKGLCLAGLNFPGNAVYAPEDVRKENIAPFELIPCLLGQCETVDAALEKIAGINLWNMPFSDSFPITPLHWLLADRSRAVALEPMADGLKIHENPVGVLTNNPPFDFHMLNLANYRNLSAGQGEKRFGDVQLNPCSLGMGAIGLPGDLSSASRFVRAAFVKLNSISDVEEAASVSQFFHILGSVAQPKGLNRLDCGACEYTRYSCCCNADRGVYYYTTYENSRISAVDIHRENLEGDALVSYPLVGQEFFYQN